MNNVIIIGSGLGGLTAACTLAARGYKVKVFEKNDWTGGKACVLEEKGFRFDMGPTILTIPSVLKRVFEEAGEKMEDHLDLVRLDPQWRSFFSDRSVLDLTEDLGKMKENLREFTRVAEDVQNYERFLVEAQRLHDIRCRIHCHARCPHKHLRHNRLRCRYVNSRAAWPLCQL